MQFETTYILGGNIELEIEFNYIGAVPACIDKLPEDCYPAEDEEIEILSVTCNGKQVDTDDIGIFNSGTYETLDNEIEEFISSTHNDWMVGPEE